jgi:hypothetical protein
MILVMQTINSMFLACSLLFNFTREGGGSWGVTNFAYILENPDTLIIVAMLCD